MEPLFKNAIDPVWFSIHLKLEALEILYVVAIFLGFFLIRFIYSKLRKKEINVIPELASYILIGTVLGLLLLWASYEEPINRPIRYYGILFGLAAVMSLLSLKYLFKIKKYPVELVDDFAIYLLVGIVIGARVVHVAFYGGNYFNDPNDPFKALKIWEGGIASHGATLGAVLGAMVFAKVRKIGFYKVADLAALPIALGTMFIRLGNFINSEIVGRVTDLSWSVVYEKFHLTFQEINNIGITLTDLAKYKLKLSDYGYRLSGEAFQYYKSQLIDDSFIKSMMLKYYSLSESKLTDLLSPAADFKTQYLKNLKLQELLSGLPRHPSQIYEMLYGLFTFLVLWFLFKRRDKLADGVLLYTFFTVYFTFRFLTEFVKEYQTLSTGLTMGQYLSLPFVIIGLFMIYWLQKRKKAVL